MGSFSLWHWFILLVLAVGGFILPLWLILQRTGRPGWIALFVAVPYVGPLVGIGILWFLAAGRWPAMECAAPTTTLPQRT